MTGPHDLLTPAVNSSTQATVRNPKTGNTYRVENVYGELWNVSMVGSCECGLIHEAEVTVDAGSISQASKRGESRCDDLLAAEIDSCDCQPR